ncbi:hypothetical protein DRE_03309 [Drechslerella stenobrocha 248]|uniref:Mid2 domain-containing protein n=1 Tax=Drechslerella stenobrocha 248 TaxID=1043628 RepID=W7IDX1_9PEZI|nr:hypothetical protein DRE_03309 [Drechslerella stenobrocha 248]
MKLNFAALSAPELLASLLVSSNILLQLVSCLRLSDSPQRRQISSASLAQDFPSNPPFGNFTTAASSSTSYLSVSSQPRLTSTITEIPITTQVTITHVVTDEFGRQSTSFDVVPTTTMIPSDDPSLANNGESGAPSGVTPQQKKIIIGVVVSVVGFLSVAGIAGVIWRIWFTRRGNEEGHVPDQKASMPLSSIEPGAYINDGNDRKKKLVAGSMDPSSNF